MTGQTSWHYRLLEPLGSGGMGVVYRAEDTSLGRAVALKFLHAGALDRDDLRTRLLREARLAASINHPNVCTIYEVGEIPEGAEFIGGTHTERLPPGTPFIAMELLTGERLSDRLVRAGRMPVKELLAAAVQVAEGMHEAHTRNIVHRDLKPHNVLIDAAGRVKILDFGLAKPLDPPRAEDSVMVDALTRSAELTRMGVIVGTVAYMSPEQAQGKALDSRSDLFSFGVMLYELATGTRPFDGQSPTSTMAKILEVDPRPLRDAAPHLPADLDRIVRRCLQKNPADRYQDARDLVLDLRDVQQSVASGLTSAVNAGAPRSSHVMVGAAVAGVVAIAALAAALAFMRRPATPAPIVTHRQVTFSGNVLSPALSPDGKFVAYVVGGFTAQEQRVVVQELAGGQPLDVYKGRIGSDLAWSPDGSELAFSVVTSESSFASFVVIVPRLGGPARRLTARAAWVAWSPDGTRLAGARSGSGVVDIMDKTSGETTQIRLDGSFAFIRGVAWSSSGNRLAFATWTGDERSALLTIAVDGTNQQQVLEESASFSSPKWSAAGDAIYYLRGIRGGVSELWKVPVAANGRSTGGPALVLGGVPSGETFTLARDGTQLAYTRALTHSNLFLVTIPPSTTSTQARVQQLTTGTFSDTRPSISPDGLRVAFSRRTGETSVIYSMPVDGSGAPQQLTFSANAESPSWSPDGKELAFVSSEGGRLRIWTAGAAGGPPRVFAGTEASAEPNIAQVSWGSRGTILYQRPGNRTFHALEPATQREVPLVKDESVGWVFAASYSPDATQVAVYWNRPPQYGLWIMSAAGAAEKRIYDGYAMPAGWSSDGKRVLALVWSDPARLMSIPVAGGMAQELALLPWPTSGNNANCTTRDGERFVCAVAQSSSDVWLAQHFDPDLR